MLAALFKLVLAAAQVSSCHTLAIHEHGVQGGHLGGNEGVDAVEDRRQILELQLLRFNLLGVQILKQQLYSSLPII